MNIMQTETGQLKVGVYDTSIAKPIENAQVTILGMSENNLFNTDVSGQTQIISLYAPPIDYSLSPDMPKPFSAINITVTADGFIPSEINGIQIFADNLALQEVILLPIESNEAEGEINIEDPTLWGNFPEKIPEESEKELPEETGFVVLDNPVIPEYIVVHDGSPNDDSAPNYYVEFKSYIKNVASCEIYSTWPDAAIRANVLVIISFTLNRVFTEWYRNKGKNFVITSSTAYDQAFSYGRNIYEEISVIVDEMFTTYITKPNIRQPLLTQYCDGSRVSCPNWLSQWGSKSLADQGYTASQILKYYYGNDMYLTQAEQVKGVPSSFPNENLQVGSSGNSVRTIQTQLNAISNTYTEIPKLRADGIYGEQTEEAVKQFQKIFNLPQTGIVDFPTWYEISAIYVAVEKIAELV